MKYHFPGSSAGKEFACNVGDLGSIPELGKSTGEGIGYPLQYSWTSLVAQMVKNLPAMQETWVQSLGWEDPWRKEWQPTPVSLPGESHGQRNLAGCSPRGHRVRHDWVTEHACMHHLLKNFFYFYTIFNGYFPYCFTIQFFQNIRCVVQYILEPILYPRVCASHSSTPILALPASGNQLLVLCICKFTSFMLHSLV